MQKCFYDITNNLHITDISGLKTKEQIKEEFSLSELPQEIEFDEVTEAVRFSGTTLIKYSYKLENQQAVTEKELKRKTKEAKIKLKFNNLFILK